MRGPLRQLTTLDLGHEEPTVLLTNQLHLTPAKLIERYSQRMVIENGIAEAIDFFHMDALSSAVPMKVNCEPAVDAGGEQSTPSSGSSVGQWV